MAIVVPYFRTQPSPEGSSKSPVVTRRHLLDTYVNVIEFFVYRSNKPANETVDGEQLDKSLFFCKTMSRHVTV